MLSRVIAVLGCAALAAGRAGQWEAVADGIPELDAVEKALQKVVTAKLGPEQQKAAAHTVQDVEHVLADLKNGKSLTREQKNAKVKGAVEELQRLQSQWELAEVEAALKQVVADPHLGAKQLAVTKTVVADVEHSLDSIESGKLDAKTRNEKVVSAIRQLSDLQHQLSNTTQSPKETELAKKIAQKKVLLAKTQKELQIVNLEKQLLDKKVALQKLIAQKSEAEAHEKERQEDAVQQAQVSNLIAAAKALASARKAIPKAAANASNASNVKKEAVAAADASNASSVKKEAVKAALVTKSNNTNNPLSAILIDLNARVEKSAAQLTKLDSEFHKREAELKQSIQKGEGAARGKKDSIARSAEMLKMLLNRERRSYEKVRAMRMAEKKELQDGVSAIKRGDVSALSGLLNKMQSESKLMQAKANSFLHF